jgi:hypothetical protein
LIIYFYILFWNKQKGINRKVYIKDPYVPKDCQKNIYIRKNKHGYKRHLKDDIPEGIKMAQNKLLC